jgi:DNA polymerase-3 subunit gamma/tau
MLTNQAFNALLKTLEEPPKNVIFILATTEVHKVLDTIKSRCQRFDFKRITTEDISKHLRYIADKEEINITDEALSYIAQNSAGGMRDSIALLDQLSVLNSADAAIGVDDINSLLGRLSFDSLTSLFSSIVASKQNEALSILNDIYNQGNEPIQILSNLLEYFRNALVLKSVNGEINNSVVQLNSEQMQILVQKLSDVETHQLVSLIDKCAAYIKELKITTTPKLWLDVAILDLSNMVENTKLEDLQKRLSLLESGEGARVVNVSPYNTPPAPVKKTEVMKPIKPEKQAVPVAPKKIEAPKPQATASEEEVLTESVPMSKASSPNSLKTLWAKYLENISSFPSRAILKQQAIPVKLTESEVIITIKNPTWLKQFAQDGSKHPFIVEAANSLFGQQVKKVIVRAPESGDEAIRKEQSSKDDDESPAPAPKKVETKSTPAPVKPQMQKPKVESVTVQNESADESSEVDVSEAGEPLPIKRKGADAYHSDGVNMVMELFDGKFIE